MIRGLNTNIKRNEKIYHIQTEDAGTKIAFITAHLFIDGAVLASVKTDYSDISGLSEEELSIEVAERMRRSHRSMINRLTSGDFDKQIESHGKPQAKQERDPAPAAADQEPLPKSIDLSPVLDIEPSEPEAPVESEPKSTEVSESQDTELVVDPGDSSIAIDLGQSAEEAKQNSDEDSSAEAEKLDSSRDSQPTAYLSRGEQVKALMQRFDEVKSVADISVTRRIRELLDGPQK